MTSAQRVIKYVAMTFAIFLIVNIISAIIFGLYTAGSIFGLVNSDENIITEDLRDISSEVTKISTLKIDLGFTNLQIKSGDRFKVETNNSKISFEENNGNVVIREEKHNWLLKEDNKESNLIIYIPEDMIALDEVKLETGAGEIKIDTLKAQGLYFNLGAGKVHIENVTATKEAKIDGGAGKIEMLSAEINNLDLDMGVGEVDLQAKVTGKSDIDAGIGNLNIKLYGEKESYKIDADKGLGNIKIDNTDIAKDAQVFGYGENHIKIDGGVGNITIDFINENN